MADYKPYGGEPPSQRHSDTSIAAATKMRGRIGPLHVEVIRFLSGCAGATDEEMQRGIPMPANTQRPRRRELQLMGLVHDSHRRRVTSSRREAVVWVFVPDAKRQRPTK